MGTFFQSSDYLLSASSEALCRTLRCANLYRAGILSEMKTRAPRERRSIYHIYYNILKHYIICQHPALMSTYWRDTLFWVGAASEESMLKLRLRSCDSCKPSLSHLLNRHPMLRMNLLVIGANQTA